MRTCKSGDCGCNDNAGPLPAIAAMPVDSATLMLKIDKMDCPTEEALIRKKLESLAGVEGLDFNLMQRRLTVKHRLPDAGPILAALTALRMDPVIEPAPGMPTAQRVVFSIENMDCPTEEALIRNKFSAMPGIVALDFNLMQRTLTVAHTLGDNAPLKTALRAIGMQAVESAPHVEPSRHTPRRSVARRQWWLMGIAGVAACAAEAVTFLTGHEASIPVVALAVLAIVTAGFDTYQKGWIALKNRNLNINALMSIAVTGAVLIGQWPEAAMVMFLFALAELIEALSLDRARNAIRTLIGATPEKATIQQADDSWAEVNASSVTIGALARVRPGERIALDGQVIRGESTVNQAPITGESLPVAKTIGDPVFAGSINETGSFDYRVMSDASHSTIARIIHAVEQAQGNRAPTQRFVDRFAKVYTPVVFALALAVAVVPPLAFGQPWIVWIYRALVLLVIACPCALVISTPVTVVSGLAAAARRGILVKGGAYLEAGCRLKALAIDKTGTITAGKPVVTDVVPLQGDVDEALRLAASLAERSDHPISSAVTNYWKRQDSEGHLADISHFSAIVGCGVTGRIGQRTLYLGNHRMVEECGICTAQTHAALETLEAQGKTAVVICDGNAPLAAIGVADTMRASSREAVAQLHALGLRVVMLTGDNQRTADAIAQEAGIDDARGDLLPEDKLKAVEAELAAQGSVGMVGDGINDAPALARATIGFAMGAAGTDTAIETADVALMDDDLRKIPQFIRLSAKTGAILRQNIALALGIKLVFFILALAGHASLWMAVFADMGASLIVVANGLRLLGAGKTNSSL